MEHLDGILKLVDAEFEAVEKNGKFRSREEIDSVGKLVDIVKDIHCIWEYEDGEESEYSGAYMYDRGGMNRMNRGGSYNDGGSYARGRRNARRDSMGRYSRNSYRMGGMDGYSRADKHEYVESLRDMLETAPDEQTRQSLKRMIDQMEQ